jgi:predicted O-linked N-acetylglucosamine transferase (SPINDLY family)/ubiquinone/menaquinone biosynthesis C-methylase UbiE
MGATLWLHLGRWLERKGLGVLAESCYRNGSAGAGDNALLSAYRLSQQLLAGDRNQEAADVCDRLLRDHPQYAKAWCARGAAYRRLALMDDAYESYERAIELAPDYAQAWCNLGEWWMVKGDHEAALTKFEQALQFNPRLLEALNNRVAVLYELGRFKDAEAAAAEAIAKYPDNAALHVNLGNVQLHTGKSKLAAKSFQKALECDPASPEAQIGLSTLLGESHRLAETLAYIEHEIAVKGGSAQRLVSLALAQQAKGDWAATEQTCNKVLQLQPNNAAALTTLAGCLSHRADHRGAISLFEQSLEANPQMPGIRSNIAFEATYLPDISSEELYTYHSDWAEHFEKEGVQSTHDYKQSMQADRPLRIGYVSGDFGTHPVGFLLRDVIRNHDRQQFRIYCYSMMRNDADPITATIRENADVWVDALFMSDDELSERIREDRIDILVDLAGHTAYNRLPVFVRKPAPVQVTWIGYFHSTGLKSIDYYITDPYTTPKQSGQLFSEIPVWLPHSRFCYSPPDYAPAVVPPPVLQTGRITFGSFNRIEKLVDPVIAAWVQILQAVPGSRLLLKSGALDNQAMCDAVRGRFASYGLVGDRLELRGPSAHPEMLEQYGEVDIALDPFPFNGGMTTLETLWMGVPVITLAGQGVVSRQTVSALSNIGVTELIFETMEAYVAGAIALAGDVERLKALRREMRKKMKNSPLCQSEQFAQDLEMLYRRMWQACCRGEKLGTEVVAGIPIVKKTVLHVGCGPADIRALPQLFQRRWQEIRLDIDPNVAPDVVASMLDMSPVETASVDAVYSSHNIEHLHPHEVEGALREFKRVLKPEGMLVVTCPDLQSVCALVAEDKLEDAAYISPAGPISPIDILYGHRPAMAAGNLYMAHKTGFTAKSLERALKEIGFATVIVERGMYFDLWALAYPEAISAERIELDRTGCLPPRAGALN